MLYKEFLEGTKCTDCDENMKIFSYFEAIYMNSDCTKELIYKQAKPFLRYGFTDKELEFHEEMYREILSILKSIEYLDFERETLGYNTTDNRKYYREKLRNIQFVLGDKVYKNLRIRAINEIEREGI